MKIRIDIPHFHGMSNLECLYPGKPNYPVDKKITVWPLVIFRVCPIRSIDKTSPAG